MIKQSEINKPDLKIVPDKISEKILTIKNELETLRERASYYDDLLEDGLDNNNYSSFSKLNNVMYQIKIKESELKLLQEVSNG
jgi:hypothetical protein